MYTAAANSGIAKETTLRILYLIGLFFFLAGCQTAPIDSYGSNMYVSAVSEPTVAEPTIEKVPDCTTEFWVETGPDGVSVRGCPDSFVIAQSKKPKGEVGLYSKSPGLLPGGTNLRLIEVLGPSPDGTVKITVNGRIEVYALEHLREIN